MFAAKQLESTFKEIFQNKGKVLLNAYSYILSWNSRNLITSDLQN